MTPKDGKHRGRRYSSFFLILCVWICNDNNNTLKKNFREFVKYILDTNVVVISEVSGVKYKEDEE